jgi:hypothetical protein
VINKYIYFPQEIIKVGFGSFYRRPLENSLTRLVERWQSSQPPHLRHLALVRDIALSKTVTHYIHYSVENFRKLVDSGSKDWAAVNHSTQKERATQPDLDQYGFPRSMSLPGLVKGGNASLYQCMTMVKPADYTFSASDPKAVKLADGTYSKLSDQVSLTKLYYFANNLICSLYLSKKTGEQEWFKICTWD